MTTTANLLDAWKKVRGLRTDTDAAKALGLRHSAVANWRSGRAHANAPAAAKMAEECGLDALRILAAIEADRSHDADTRRVWSRFGKGAFVALLMLASTAQGAPIPQGEKDGFAHYAKWRKGRRGPFLGVSMGAMGRPGPRRKSRHTRRRLRRIRA